jgi:dUTPase
LILHAGVIDPGYTGEIFVAASHTYQPGSIKDYFIKPYAKLPFQMVVVPFRNDFNIVTKDVYDDSVSGAKRLTGKVGSSD